MESHVRASLAPRLRLKSSAATPSRLWWPIRSRLGFPLPRRNAILNLVLIPRMGALGITIARPQTYFVDTFSLVCPSKTRGHPALRLFAPFSVSGMGARCCPVC